MGQERHFKCDECKKEAFVSRDDWLAELRSLKWTVRNEIYFFCDECSAKRASEIKDQQKQAKKDFSRIASKGARRSLVSGQVLYERKPTETGVKDERLTYLDRSNDARFLMSARLNVRDELRAVGNLYGGSVQLAEMGHGNSFAQESVDGGKHGAGGGVTPSLIEARQIADIAQHCMKSLPAIRHRANSRKMKTGAHLNIPARQLVDAICVHGYEITEVAIRFDWWAKRAETGVTFVPKQQSQKLKAALIDALSAIDEAFQEHGIDARRIGVVKVR